MKPYVLIAILPFVMTPTVSYAEHVLDEAFGQYLDIS